MKYFISGAISRYATTPEGRKEVTDKFMSAEFDLLTKQIATEVFNPIRLVDEHGWDKDWKFYMKICLVKLLECDAIYLLDGFQDSRGSNIEIAVAQRSGIMVFAENIGQVKGLLIPEDLNSQISIDDVAIDLGIDLRKMCDDKYKQVIK